MLLENKVAVIYGGGGPIGGAAARAFAREGARVFLHFGGSGPQTLPGLGGFKVALDALEALRRQWAVELGGHGIRVLTLKTGGIPETIDQSDAGGAEIAAGIAQETLLGRAATLADVGNVCAFVASDRAATMTSTEVNISCGAMVD
jgi:3-oxoacyl-[acyl-carrier protein] reductase